MQLGRLVMLALFAGLLGSMAQVGAATPDVPRAGLAWVRDYEIVTNTPDQDSANVKNVIASCPAGKVTLGGGARLVGAIPGVALLSSRPANTATDAPMTLWQGVALEQISNDSSWGISVFVICGNVEGYEVVTVISPLDPTDTKTQVAACPAGKTALSGGAHISGAVDDLTMLSSHPTDSGGWQAAAMEQLPNINGWRLRVDVICGNVAGYQMVTAQTGSDSMNDKEATAICPAHTIVLGGGARLGGGMNGMAVGGSHPASSQNSEKLDGWLGIGNELFANPENWDLRVDVICAAEPYILALPMLLR
jgi:hypothetical protein